MLRRFSILMKLCRNLRYSMIELRLTSAGAIAPGVAREEFFAGYSIPRNKILMRIFRDLKIVGYLGSGMPIILQAYPKESFIFTQNFIRIVFQIDPVALEMEKQGNNSKEETGSSPKSSPKTEERIIELILKDSNITTEIMGNVLNVSKRTVLKQVDKLKKQGRLRRIGPAKGGHWEVINDG